MALNLNLKNCEAFINQKEFSVLKQKVLAANEMLINKSGAGSEFSGWHELPVDFDNQELEKIKRCAKDIINKCDVLIVIGIGGSYIGAKAAIDFLNGQFYNEKLKNTPSIYFVGNNISSEYFSDIIEIIKDKDFCINVVSKSGTTTEPAIAFRIFKDLLINKYGEKEAIVRIYATTDKQSGALKQMADTQGYETFTIYDDIGGRYSVLTAVGLLPMAVSGIDIEMVICGAKAAYHDLLNPDFSQNPSFKYAAIRNYFYDMGKIIEIFVSYEPKLLPFGEWLKQLFAESEGKDKKGIFPVFSLFSTDLHSIGQYIQDGQRNQFETVIWIENANTDIIIKKDDSDIDKLNFLSDKSLNFVNKQAYLGASLAHVSGGVPTITISIDKSDEYHYGYLVYFFLKSCAISGYILGVNPFDQPGVEAYKQNMFALLSKPGYEDLKQRLLKDLG